MSELMFEKARELGRMLGQTPEHQALQRARARIADDREAVTRLNRLGELVGELARALQQGKAPPEEAAKEYEQVFAELQSSSVYQELVAGQSNFDKVLGRVNEEISKGMEAGGQSRIILPS
jgi:cell fate (sporulation/competence/biofilm development) regulator YlbF (YheA/YmcA/DUF963 family)